VLCCVVLCQSSIEYHVSRVDGVVDGVAMLTDMLVDKARYNYFARYLLSICSVYTPTHM
jgi:hypothetical protein